MKSLKFYPLLILTIVSINLSAQTLAFPGAEGYGKYTTGGRGGRVIEVTNLLDRDRRGSIEEGSLRAALNTEGDDPITIVFKVSGVIELTGQLKSSRPNMTIAGQTAPGGGICIKDGSVFLSGDNLIIRYVRFRPGDELQAETTALNIENAQDIIIDHCSMSWSVEENMGFYDNKYTTIQYCILSEGLYNSFDGKGARSYGAQWGGQYASYHHNLFAHNRSRSPRINGSYSNDTMAIIDFRNNVIFNWGGKGAIYGAEEAIEGGKAETNFVNNYYKPGPASEEAFARPSYARTNIPATGYASWYFSGNYMEGITGGMNDDNWLGVEIIDEIGSADNIRSDVEFEVEPIPTETAQEALESVTREVGAILPTRDGVDQRIIQELKGEVALQTPNGIIDSPSEVGGWSEYDALFPLEDADGDGMPDKYEGENGLDPADAEDGKEIQANGYSNLEIYLNSIAGITGSTTLDPLRSGPNEEVITLYPNPMGDWLNLKNSKDLQAIRVFDAQGKLILESQASELSNNFINVETLQTGVYIMKLSFNNGREVSQRIIKK
ncbi:MAG: T9SS type A sorting domain-containing protein [Marinoscillum sp.]